MLWEGLVKESSQDPDIYFDKCSQESSNTLDKGKHVVVYNSIATCITEHPA